mgnify:CR=1 FL=1
MGSMYRDTVENNECVQMRLKKVEIISIRKMLRIKESNDNEVSLI